jgi:hypothetical protein
MIAFRQPHVLSVGDFTRIRRLSPAGQALAQPARSLRELFDTLRAQEHDADAIQVLPHLLPKRAAVWWGTLWAWQAHRPAPSATSAAALEATLNWVYEPSEENRRATEAPARAATMTSSAGCLAWASFWSDGSMTSPELPTVTPPPHVTAVVVAGAILLACVERDALQYLDHYRQALDLGLEIAKGRLLWTPSGSPGAVADPRRDRLPRADHANPTRPVSLSGAPS